MKNDKEQGLLMQNNHKMQPTISYRRQLVRPLATFKEAKPEMIYSLVRELKEVLK